MGSTFGLLVGIGLGRGHIFPLIWTQMKVKIPNKNSLLGSINKVQFNKLILYLDADRRRELVSLLCRGVQGAEPQLNLRGRKRVSDMIGEK